MSKTAKDRLRDRIDSFLEERRKSEDGSWAEVRKQDMNSLWEIIDDLIGLKFEPDLDGDLPIEVRLIDRSRGYLLPFHSLGYLHREGADVMRIFSFALNNLRMASQEVERISAFMEDERRFPEMTDRESLYHWRKHSRKDVGEIPADAMTALTQIATGLTLSLPAISNITITKAFVSQVDFYIKVEIEGKDTPLTLRRTYGPEWGKLNLTWVNKETTRLIDWIQARIEKELIQVEFAKKEQEKI